MVTRAFAVRRSFIPKRNPTRRISQRAWKACDRCGFMFHKEELRKQRGLWLDEACYDDLSNER